MTFKGFKYKIKITINCFLLYKIHKKDTSPYNIHTHFLDVYEGWHIWRLLYWKTALKTWVTIQRTFTNYHTNERYPLNTWQNYIS
jgi:hypothetical protein